MILKTFDTILSELIDEFDKLISPMKLSRANSNVIYLIFKAYAKGLEVINNLVVSLSNKFNPEKCTNDDLVSIAKLVGTNKYLGSATGLKITFENINSDAKEVILKAGTYTYELNRESVFTYLQQVDETILPGKKVSKLFMSTTISAIPVTEQPSIIVTAIDLSGTKLEIDSSLIKTSCEDNKGLIGTPPEDDLTFRQRIVQGNTTSNIFDKMRNEIIALPYVFDCQLYFNPYADAINVDGINILPFHLLVVISGKADDKIAEIVASYGIYQTVVVNDLNFVKYNNDIFRDGFYKVHYMHPRDFNYDLEIYYEADAKAITDNSVSSQFNSALNKYRNVNIYSPVITERLFSNYLADLKLPTVTVLNVNIVHAEETKDFFRIPKTSIAKLNNIKVINVSEER